ncbi:MAG: two-component regulator propeller domain-containing protein [Prolixibacteraceae bacterium]
MPIVVIASGNSYSSQLLVKYLTLEDGLPNNKVNAIAKDKNGFMWFGTNDGLCRYDGFQIQIYSLDDLQGSDSRTPQIGALKTDQSGNLLIGSYTFFRYNYDTDQVEECSMEAPEDSIQNTGRVHALETGPDGLTYIGAENGLFSFNPATNQVLLISTILSDEKQIISLFSDGEQLWIGTENSALYRYQYLQQKLYPVKSYNLPSIEKNQLLCFYKYQNDFIWMGTQDNGLFRFNLKDSTLSKIPIDKDLTFANRIRKIIHDSDGNIWLATRGGLYIYNNGVFTRKAYQENPISSLSANSIYDILIDDQSTIWLGTFNGGVNYIHLNRKPFVLNKLQKFPTRNAKCNINCFAEDNRGNLWIGTGDFGLYFKDNTTGNIEQYATDLPSHHRVPNDIKALAVDSSGNAWAGTYMGLSFIDRSRHKIITYSTENSAICFNQIRSIKIDKEQNIFIGTNNGLSYFNAKTQTFRTYLTQHEISTIYIDRNETIWVGASTNGLFQFNPKRKEFERVYAEYFNTFIRCILVDSNNNLWIGNNKGLFFVNRSTDSILSFGLKEGLPTLRINGLLEDENKNLWVSTGAGLLKCNRAIDQPENFNFNSFSINDGLQGRQFRQDAYFKSSTGEMYFGGDLGYNQFYPPAIKDDYNSPKIALTNLKIYNKAVQIGQKLDGQLVLPKAINELSSIDLSYKHRLFTIEFTALHYTNPLGNQYRYRLVPFQNQWVTSSGLRNFANYSNLKGGTYSFQLEVANSDGIWNPVARELKIQIHPPFWQTNWFIFLLIIFTIGTATIFYYLRINQLKNNNLTLEKKVAERTTELKESVDHLVTKQKVIEEQSIKLEKQKNELLELNSTKDKFFTIIAHDLKNPFQSILGMSELLSSRLTNYKPNEIKLFVKEIFNSANQIYSLLENLLTWARTQTNRIEFNPERINLFPLINDSAKLLEKNILDKKLIINYKIETQTEVLVDRNMIETVIRNLLSNAIKYTPVEGSITLQLQSDADHLKFSITDSGVGIPQNVREKLFVVAENKSLTGTEGEKGTGLGLIICNEFIQRNNGEIGVTSELDKGSTFYFTIPLIKEPVIVE